MGWFKRLIGQNEARPKATSPAIHLRQPIVPNPKSTSADHGRTEPPAPAVRHRQPPPPVRKPGLVYRSDYLSSEDETRLLTLDNGGMPTGHLRRVADRLIITPDSAQRAMVNPKSSTLYRLGLFSFGARGTAHYPQARLGLGQPVRLVREPNNSHDVNAIALHTATGAKPFGYVNNQNAARLAKLIDAGEKIEAICVRAPGSAGVVPMILAARRHVLAHLSRTL